MAIVVLAHGGWSAAWAWKKVRLYWPQPDIFSSRENPWEFRHPKSPILSTASKRVAIYLRVSTSEQTTTNQRRELQALAKRHYRKDRQALDGLLKMAARREVDMVAAWSVDRLGPLFDRLA